MEGDGTGEGPIVVRVGLKIDTGIVGQQQSAGRTDSADRVPGRTTVDGIPPNAVGGIGADQSNSGYRPTIGVGDVVLAAEWRI